MHGAVEQAFSASPQMGSSYARPHGGHRPPFDGMPKGPAKRDKKRSGSSPKPSELPKVLCSIGKVMEVETLISSNSDSSFQLTC